MDSRTRSDLMRQRYGALTPDRPTLSDPVVDLMLQHRSVRRFSSRALPDGLLETIIAAGQSAPTSSNMQAVSVIAVTDPVLRQRMSQLASGQAFVAEAPLVLCFVLDQSRAKRVEATLDTQLFALDMLDNFIAAATDCAIFAQNVALAAESLGLGSCFVGNLRNEPETLASLLQLPPKSFVIFGLCVGYEDGHQTAVRPRLPQSVVLHHDRYSPPDHEAAQLAFYDEVFRAHEEIQHRPAAKWTERHRDRYASLEYLAGRDKLMAMLRKLGFVLK